MMTPSELREYEFKGAGRNAYKSDDVDNFFGEVAVAYEKVFRENAELVKRVGLLADRLEQLKQDEEQIKQAVIGAQKAADIIVKEAEDSVEDIKAEADAILAAAKGEADIIKADAEKQAIADSDLLLSIARDKAEEIINKAKEEAHGILIEANDSAKDTVGAATRTITSESLHYEMLKKEVSEFRASILAQYKAHIELISKLPELAVEEAEKIEETAEETNVTEDIVEEISAVDPENEIIEFIDDEAADDFSVNEETQDEEDVVVTTLPFDFFEENSTLEFVNEEDAEKEAETELDNELAEDASEDEVEFSDSEEPSEEIASSESAEINEDEADTSDDKENNEEPDDIPISRGFTVNPINLEDDVDIFSHIEDNNRKPMFSSFETIDDDEEDMPEEETKKKRGFFRRKK